jgi:hypothetical protein
MLDQETFVALIAFTTARRAPEGGSTCIHTLDIPGSCLSIEKRDPGELVVEFEKVSIRRLSVCRGLLLGPYFQRPLFFAAAHEGTLRLTRL